MNLNLFMTIDNQIDGKHLIGLVPEDKVAKQDLSVKQKDMNLIASKVVTFQLERERARKKERESAKERESERASARDRNRSGKGQHSGL